MEAKHLRMLQYAVFSTAVCILIAVVYFIVYRKGKKLRVGDVVLAIVLVVVSSLRYGMGSDYIRYMESAANWAEKFSDLSLLFTPQTILKYSFEIGYKFLSVVSYSISSSPYMIFWIVSLVMYIPMVYYCRKYTRDSAIAIAVFLLFGYWGMSLNIIQQYIAMVIILFEDAALRKRKYPLFLVLAVCAELFHTTAIVATIILLIVHAGVLKRLIRPTQKNLVIMIGIGVFLRIGTQLLTPVLTKISLFAKYIKFMNAEVTDNIGRKYIMYGALLETILIIIMVYMAIRKLEELKEKEFDISHTISIIMMGIPFSIVGISKTLWLSNRFAEYFFQFIIVLLPAMLRTESIEDTAPGWLSIEKKNSLFWFIMIVWHAIFAVVMLNNNKFVIATYLFK